MLVQQAPNPPASIIKSIAYPVACLITVGSAYVLSLKRQEGNILVPVLVGATLQGLSVHYMNGIYARDNGRRVTLFRTCLAGTIAGVTYGLLSQRPVYVPILCALINSGFFFFLSRFTKANFETRWDMTKTNINDTRLCISECWRGTYLMQNAPPRPDPAGATFVSQQQTQQTEVKTEEAIRVPAQETSAPIPAPTATSTGTQGTTLALDKTFCDLNAVLEDA